MTDATAREIVVRTGTYLYAGTIVCDVRIVYSPIRYGSGDEHVDQPEDVIDQERDTYYLEYGGTEKRGAFISGGGRFDSIEEAMHRAEATMEGLTWQE